VSCLQKLSESDDKEKLQEEAEEYGLCKFWHELGELV
jgi:hypothetical protein